MDIKKIREAVGRGWCAVPNAKKAMDGDLANAISNEVLKLFPKFEQVAFHTPDIEATKRLYSSALGCREWVDDTVTARGRVGLSEQRDREAKDETNVAQLAFNYDLGIELELICYLAGRNWLELRGASGCGLSHMSYHVDNMITEQTRLERAGFRVIQSVRTLSHTNEYLLKTGRKYHYVIFDTRDKLGFDVKLIQRLETK